MIFKHMHQNEFDISSRHLANAISQLKQTFIADQALMLTRDLLSLNTESPPPLALLTASEL